MDTPDLVAQPSRRDRAALYLAMSTIVLPPSVYSFRFMSFLDAKLAALCIGISALALVASRARTEQVSVLTWMWPLALMLVWSTGLALIERRPPFSSVNLDAAARIVLPMIATPLLLGAVSPKNLQRSLALSAVPVCVLALGQRAGWIDTLFPPFPEYGQPMYSAFGNQDLLGGYAAMGLVLGIALWLERSIGSLFAAAIVVSAAPALVLSDSRSAWLAAFIGGLAALGMYGREPRRAGVIVGTVLAIVAASALLAPQHLLARVENTFSSSDTGYRIRLWIWDGALHLLAQHPLGVGIGNFAFFSPLALGEVLRARGPGVHTFNHLAVENAHSDLLDIGVGGGVVAVGLLLVFLRRIPRRRSPTWPALIALGVFAGVNSTLHSPPHLLAGLLLVGSLQPWSIGPNIPESLWSRARFAAFFALMGPLWAAVPLMDSAAYAQARNRYERQSPDFVAAYQRASDRIGGAASLELATIFANQHRLWDAQSIARRAALTNDSGALHYLMAHVSEQSGFATAASSYRECVKRWPDDAASYAGLIRCSPSAERDGILAEARPWLTEEAWTALSATPSNSPGARSVRP